MRRRLRRNARYIGAAAVVAVFSLCLVLFVNAYNDGSDSTAAAGPGTGNASASPAGPSAPVSASRSSPSSGATGPGGSLTTLPSTLPQFTISPNEPGGFRYKNLPIHRIVLRVTSSANIIGVGYLVPRSGDAAYGVKRDLGRRWSLTTTAIGTPYYAAVFVQARGTGAPVTCTIEIDGKVASAETTRGPYGRRVCLG